MKNYLLFFLLSCGGMMSCRKCETPPPGNQPLPAKLVTINQRQVEISHTPGTTPTIVLIAGFGNDLKSWQKLYNRRDAAMPFFAYNRPGIGLSQEVPGPRDARTLAEEMKTLLDASQIKPPYVLVAHSMGGIYARMFKHLYPERVKGMVLIDATHERQLDSLLSLLPESERQAALAGLTAAHDSLLNSLPEGAVKEEFRASFATNYEQIRSCPPITGIPLYVITSTRVTDDNPPFVIGVKKALHQQWAAAAGSMGNFTATASSGHDIHVEEPGLVMDAIRWVLSR